MLHSAGLSPYIVRHIGRVELNGARKSVPINRLSCGVRASAECLVSLRRFRPRHDTVARCGWAFCGSRYGLHLHANRKVCNVHCLSVVLLLVAISFHPCHLHLGVTLAKTQRATVDRLVSPVRSTDYTPSFTLHSTLCPVASSGRVAQFVIHHLKALCNIS